MKSLNPVEALRKKLRKEKKSKKQEERKVQREEYILKHGTGKIETELEQLLKLEAEDKLDGPKSQRLKMLQGQLKKGIKLRQAHNLTTTPMAKRFLAPSVESEVKRPRIAEPPRMTPKVNNEDEREDERSALFKTLFEILEDDDDLELLPLPKPPNYPPPPPILLPLAADEEFTSYQADPIDKGPLEDYQEGWEYSVDYQLELEQQLEEINAPVSATPPLETSPMETPPLEAPIAAPMVTAPEKVVKSRENTGKIPLSAGLVAAAAPVRRDIFKEATAMIPSSVLKRMEENARLLEKKTLSEPVTKESSSPPPPQPQPQPEVGRGNLGMLINAAPDSDSE